MIGWILEHCEEKMFKGACPRLNPQVKIMRAVHCWCSDEEFEDVLRLIREKKLRKL
jgi:hypothetical protein